MLARAGSWRNRLLPWAAFVVLWGSGTGVARATEPVALDYRVPRVCPSRATFEARTRSPAARLGEGWALRLSVTETPADFAGSLELSRATPESEAADSRSSAPTPGVGWSRQLRGKDCRDVVLALAMSLSVHVESLDPPDEPPTSAAQVEPAPNAGSTDTAADVPAVDGRAGAPPAPRERWALAVATGVHVRSGLGAGLTPSGGLALEAKTMDGAPRSYRVGFELAEGDTARLPRLGAAWDHRWWAAGARACPWGHTLRGSLRLEPCLGLQAGRFDAEIEGGPVRARWFGFAELVARLGVQNAAWGASVELGGQVPFGRRGIERNQVVFFREGPGVTGGIEISYAPFVGE